LQDDLLCDLVGRRGGVDSFCSTSPSIITSNENDASRPSSDDKLQSDMDASSSSSKEAKDPSSDSVTSVGSIVVLLIVAGDASSCLRTGIFIVIVCIVYLLHCLWHSNNSTCIHSRQISVCCEWIFLCLLLLLLLSLECCQKKFLGTARSGCAGFRLRVSLFEGNRLSRTGNPSSSSMHIYGITNGDWAWIMTKTMTLICNNC
jgi:hypothetical protein